MGCTQSAVLASTHLNKREASSQHEDPALEMVMSSTCERRQFHEEFRIVEKLGLGAYASVFLAEPAKDHDAKPVAAKVLDLRPAGITGPQSFACKAGAKQAKMALKEIRMMDIAASKDHIVQLLDVIIEGPLCYILMEPCEKTLLQVLDMQTELTERTLCPLWRQMFEALSVLHQACVAHRDIKPDNFLCTRRTTSYSSSSSSSPATWSSASSSGTIGGTETGGWQIKLCDFGLAREVCTEEECGLTGIFGTPPFMAPEMLAKQSYGVKVDVWSLGVIVYTTLFGTFPYVGVEKTSASMKAAILAGTPAPKYEGEGMQDLTASAPAETLVKNCLIRDPEQRISSQDALASRFFQPEAASELSVKSIQKGLSGAKTNGAFFIRKKAQLLSDVDLHLLSLQEKYHGNATLDYGSKSDLSTEACTATFSNSPQEQAPPVMSL